VVTLGALAVSTAVVIGAFAVIDQRAAEVLKAEPRVVPSAQKRAPPAAASRTRLRDGGSQAARGSPAAGTAPAAAANAQTVGSGAVNPSVAAPPQLDGDKKLRTKAHHHGRHGRRSARRHSEESPSPEPPSRRRRMAANPPPSFHFVESHRAPLRPG